jgi:Zn-dependent protease with chaperone function
VCGINEEMSTLNRQLRRAEDAYTDTPPEDIAFLKEKLAKLGSGGNSIAQKLLGTHPISRERLAAIKAEVSKYPATGLLIHNNYLKMQKM